MLIRFTTSVAGANFAYRNKQVVELRPDLAKEFLRAGQAIKVEEEQPVATGLAGLIPGLRRRRRGARSAEVAVNPASETRS